MTKRPLNQRFGPKAEAEIKITTIRDKAWPIGKPIMLYHWSDKPYRSKQIDCCAVEVVATWPILIYRTDNGAMEYHTKAKLPRPLWSCEGFDSESDMDAWFSAKMKPGQSVEKHLMKFKRI